LVYISTEKFRSLSRGKARKGDLIITLRGTLGSCCIFDCEQETAFINAQMMLIRPKGKVTSTFLHAVLTSDAMHSHLLRIGNGAAVPQLTASQLASINVPVPMIAMQKCFSDRLALVGTLQEVANSSLRNLDVLFASLQHRAFRGEL
jgi:type I restriction enzyme S subunit